MTVEPGSLKGRSIPGEAQLRTIMIGLNVVKPGTAGIAVRLFVENDERVFFSGRPVFYCKPYIVFQPCFTCTGNKGIHPQLRFMESERKQMVVIAFLQRTEFYPFVFQNDLLLGDVGNHC